MQNKPCFECNGYCGHPTEFVHNDTQSDELDVLTAYAYEDMQMQIELISEVEYRVERMEMPREPLFLN